MLFLKAITTDGELEYFNTENILSIKPINGGENFKILMGAGLFWKVKADTVETVKMENIFKNNN